MGGNLTFGSFELDDSLFQLSCDGERVPLEPKAFDLLRYLVEHRDRVVSKDELLDRLWPGEHVTEAVLPTHVTKLRAALGDDRKKPTSIQTVHGRGYRFIAAVSAVAAPSAVLPDRAAMPEPPVAGRPLVGREAPMQLLEEALESAIAGRGQVRLVVGEPGIGKTRLALEFAARARGQGARVLTGRCTEAEGAPAFWPWIQIVRAHAALSEDDALRRQLGAAAGDVVAWVPELATRLGELPAGLGLDSLDADEARFRLFDGVSLFLAAISKEQPLVLVLDDLHWADRSSAMLLRHLAAQASGEAMLILGTYRDVELRHGDPLASVLADLARESACARIALRGLAPSDVGRFIANVADRDAPESIVSAVHDLTEGNPFFVGEIVHLLLEEGDLDAGDAAPSLALPQSVLEAVGRRLAGLSVPCRGALAWAAVLGRDFSLPALERVAALEREVLLELLEEAVSAGVVSESVERLGRYAFAHALVRQTLYDELSTPRRVKMHRAVGEALESLCAADPEPYLAELAHHFFQASAGGQEDKAIDYARRAAAAAVALYGWEEAAARYADALQIAEGKLPVDAGECAELMLELASQRVRAGVASAQADFLRAAELARQANRPELFGEAALGVANIEDLDKAAVELARQLLEEALERVSAGPDAIHSRVLSELASNTLLTLDTTERATMSERAVELARRSGDTLALTEALNARATALFAPEALALRAQVHDEMLELSVRLGSKRAELKARNNRVRHLVAFGEMAEADLEIAACGALGRELRQPHCEWDDLRNLSMRAIGNGNFDEAEVLIERARVLGERINEGTAGLMHTVSRGWLLHMRGEEQAMAREYSPVLEQYSWTGSFVIAVRMFLNCVSGKGEEVRGLWEAFADNGFRDLRRDEHWMICAAGAVEAATWLAPVGGVQALYELLLPFAGQNVSHQLLRIYWGPVNHFLGLAASLLGRDSEAAGHFEDAIADALRMGTRPCLVSTHRAYADLLARRGDQAADEHRRLANELAQALGMKEISGAD